MTLADVLESVVAALREVAPTYTRTFLQPRGDLPTWPAIRLVVVSSTPYPDACGDGGDAGADFRLQVDIASASSAGESAMQALRASVMTEMTALGPEYLWDGEFNEFDEPTRTFRCSLDYVVHLSSDPPGSP